MSLFFLYLHNNLLDIAYTLKDKNLCCVFLLQKQLDTSIKVPTWQTQNSDDKKKL